MPSSDIKRYLPLKTGVSTLHKVIAVALLCWSSMSTVADQPASTPPTELVLGTQKPIDSPSGAYLNLVYTEAFRRLGIQFIYQHYPAKRSSLLSDNGTLDGELSRIHSYGDLHPNLIRVEEPNWTSGFIVVAVGPSIHLDGWESLRNTEYKVLYMAGIKGCEVNLPKVVKPEMLDVVMQNAHAFRMLLRGRADLFVGAEMDLMGDLQSDEFKDSPLTIVGVMQTFTGHVYLHKRHEALVPRLAATLRKMRQEGLLEDYRKQSNLNFLIQQHPINKP